MITTLPSMEAFGTQFQTSRREKALMAQHARWYEDDFRTLLPRTDNLASGYALLDTDDIIHFPLFSTASEFINDAVIGEMPAISTETDAQREWIDEHRSMIDRALRDATRYWSIHDLAVFTSEPGFIRAVDPTYYYRVGEPSQRDAVVGHIIAYPYREPDLEEINTGSDLERVPNRIKVLKVYPASETNPQGQRSTVQTFLISGEAGIVGQPVTAEEESPISAVCIAGRADSWYEGARDIASRILLEGSNIHQDLNRYRNRIQFVPASVAAAMRLSLPRQERESATGLDLRSKIEGKIRPMIALDAATGEEPFDFPEQGIDLSYAFEFYRSMWDSFFITAGVPPSSYGIGVGRGESGYAREKAQDAASSRARAYRRDLTDCLPQLSIAAGCPAMPKDLGFTWIAPPFKDRGQTEESVLMQLERAS